MAENDKADINPEVKRDENIGKIIDALEKASSIESKEPEFRFLKNQIKAVVAPYNKDFTDPKFTSSEKFKNNTYGLMESEFKKMSTVMNMIGDNHNVSSSNTTPIKDIIDQAALAFAESRKFNFKVADTVLETINPTKNKDPEISQSQSEVKEAKPVKKDLENQLYSMIDQLKKIKNEFSEIKNELIKDLRENRQSIEAQHKTLTEAKLNKEDPKNRLDYIVSTIVGINDKITKGLTKRNELSELNNKKFQEVFIKNVSPILKEMSKLLDKDNFNKKNVKEQLENVDKQLDSAINKIENIVISTIEKIKDKTLKAFKKNDRLVKVFNNTISPILSEMYKLQDRVNYKKDPTIISANKLTSSINNLPSNLTKFKDNMSKEFEQKGKSLSRLKDESKKKLTDLQNKLTDFNNQTTTYKIEKLQGTIDTVIDTSIKKIDKVIDTADNIKNQIGKGLIVLKNKATGQAVIINGEQVTQIINNSNEQKRKNTNKDVTPSQDQNHKPKPSRTRSNTI